MNAFAVKSVDRRSFLKFLGGAAVLATMPSLAQAKVQNTRSLHIKNLHTGEVFQGEFWKDGAYIPSAIEALHKLFRDHRQNEVAKIDHRVFDIIFSMKDRLGFDGQIELISGYRSPKTNKMLASKSGAVAKKSYHMRGMAADIRMPGVKLAALRDTAKKAKLGGVGYYPKDNFVHLDCGPVRAW